MTTPGTLGAFNCGCNRPQGPTDEDTRCASCWWVRNSGIREGCCDDCCGVSYGGRPVQGFDGPPAPAPMAVPAPQGLADASTGTRTGGLSRMGTGAAAAAGAVVGLGVGGAIGASIGSGATRMKHAGAGGLVGVLVGAFAGAYLASPADASTSSSGGQ